MGTESTLNKSLAVLFKVYEKTNNKDLFESYFVILKAYDAYLVSRSIFGLIKTSKFFPRISEILEFVNEQEKIAIEREHERWKNEVFKGSPNKPLSDLDYTILQYIGEDFAKNIERQWYDVKIKPRFIEAYNAVKIGNLTLIKDPKHRYVKQLGSGYAVEQKKISANQFLELKNILKEKQCVNKLLK